jgi:hypothetical protein
MVIEKCLYLAKKVLLGGAVAKVMFCQEPLLLLLLGQLAIVKDIGGKY